MTHIARLIGNDGDIQDMLLPFERRQILQVPVIRDMSFYKPGGSMEHITPSQDFRTFKLERQLDENKFEYLEAN